MKRGLRGGQGYPYDPSRKLRSTPLSMPREREGRGEDESEGKTGAYPSLREESATPKLWQKNVFHAFGRAKDVSKRPCGFFMGGHQRGKVSCELLRKKENSMSLGVQGGRENRT